MKNVLLGVFLFSSTSSSLNGFCSRAIFVLIFYYYYSSSFLPSFFFSFGGWLSLALFGRCCA